MTLSNCTKNLTLTVVAIFAAATLSSGPALADDDLDDRGYRYERSHDDDDDDDRGKYRHGRGGGARYSIDRIAAMLAARGYTRIYEIELDDGVYEVEARREDGRRVELEVDPRTGRILDVDDDD